MPVFIRERLLNFAQSVVFTKNHRKQVFYGGFGTPDTIRTCDLQSRSFMTKSEEMPSYQDLAGFAPVLPQNIEFPATAENTGVAGILNF